MKSPDIWCTVYNYAYILFIPGNYHGFVNDAVRIEFRKFRYLNKIFLVIGQKILTKIGLMHCHQIQIYSDSERMSFVHSSM